MTLSDLERKLGYKFNNSNLLEQALTHRSFGAVHNERLEFLGDSILNCCIAAAIFSHFPSMPEGEMSRLRANLVNQAALAAISSDLELGTVLRLGEGEQKTNGASRPSILADALEAILGAVYLDTDFAAASGVVVILFASHFENVRDAKPAKDAKTALQEWLQGKHLPLPVYSVSSIEGESHRQLFHVACEVAALAVIAAGTGTSRRLAEQDAASRALVLLAVGRADQAGASGTNHG